MCCYKGCKERAWVCNNPECIDAHNHEGQGISFRRSLKDVVESLRKRAGSYQAVKERVMEEMASRIQTTGAYFQSSLKALEKICEDRFEEL